MCNYSQLVKEEGKREGILQGISEGRQQGITEGQRKGKLEGTFHSICSLMENMSIGMDEAMRLLSIPENEYDVFYDMKKSSI